MAQTLEAYPLGDTGRWRGARHDRADERARIAPFEAIELDLSLLVQPAPSMTSTLARGAGYE